MVPAATWAIFPGEGISQSIQELEQRIVTEWLPASGYEYANAPDVEVYISPDPQNARYEVWIPVVKKDVEQIQKNSYGRGRSGKEEMPLLSTLL